MEEQHFPTSDQEEEATSTPPPSPERAPDTSGAATASTSMTEAPIAAPAPFPLDLEEPLLIQEAPDPSATRQPSRPQPWQALPRRQVLLGAGIVVGAAAIGTGTTLAFLSQPSTPRSSSASTSPSGSQFPSTTTVKPLPTQTPVSEDTLRAWRTRHLTAQPSQRFHHHTGTGIVPLAVLEPTYPNPFNPYQIHLQGYVLGGVLVAKTQFFLYLGLESLDASQFVAKVRVGPVDQTSDHFGLLILQQSTDDIEGGPAEFPQVSLAPRTLYQALPALTNHCIEVVFIRQPLPANQEGVPPGMLVEVNRQATISDAFLRADYEAIHHTPLTQLPTNSLDPIRHLIDDSPIVYRSVTDTGRYPLVRQLILRHTDQLYPRLVSG